MLSVTVGYYRNWDGNLTVTDNLERRPSDYARLLRHRACRRAVAGWRRVPALRLLRCRGQVRTVEHAGRTRLDVRRATRVSDFFAVNLSSRFGKGIQLGGGVDTGRTVSDRCFVVDSPAQTTFDFTVAATPMYCRVETPFKAQTQIKVYGGYPIAYGFVVSGMLQNVSGPQIRRTTPPPTRKYRAVPWASCRGASSDTGA